MALSSRKKNNVTKYLFTDPLSYSYPTPMQDLHILHV